MDLNERYRNTSKLALSELEEERLWQLQRNMFENQISMCDGGVDADQLPNGYGEFGLSPNNPIPCQSLLGQRMYLDRLRTANNTKVIYRRIGSFFSDVCKYPIDGYALLDTKGNTLETIYISAYQKRNSCKSPKNFYLANNLYS